MARARLSTTERVKVSLSLQEADALKALLGRVDDETDPRINERTTGLFWELSAVLDKAGHETDLEDFLFSDAGPLVLKPIEE